MTAVMLMLNGKLEYCAQVISKKHCWILSQNKFLFLAFNSVILVIITCAFSSKGIFVGLETSIFLEAYLVRKSFWD